MITAAGSGYSRWRHLAVTRWREDTTRDWFTAEEALSNAPRSANHLFVVPKVIE